MKRRLKYLLVSKEFLAAILKTGIKMVNNGLPPDATVINVVYSPEYDVYHITVHSETFRELSECEMMEQLKHISLEE